jgi:histidinol-phosphate/aromatic aminotransferase/cobyric acid decarboxylase-like protein
MAGKVLSYDAPSTEEIAQRVGLPVGEIIRFDGNTSPHLLPSTRADALAEELARIHTYPHGGYPRLEEAIARYAGVSRENIVLGAGADDLILLVTRAFAGPGDRVAIANDPTYWSSEIGDEIRLTICCRATTDRSGELPGAASSSTGTERAETTTGLTARDRARTPRRPAGARVGYAPGRDVAAESAATSAPLDQALRRRARRRTDPRGARAGRLRGLGHEPLPSHANFLYVPVGEPQELADQLLKHGLAVRPVRGGIRITIRNEQDDERLLVALQ